MLRAVARTSIAIRPASALDAATVAQMWGLYQPHHHTERAEFDSRLATLDEVALFTRRRDRALVGFCGLRRRTVKLASGRRVATVYLGLAFVEPEWRSTMLVQRMVLRRVVGPLFSPRFHRVYFWANCLTYRPYLAMARNLQEYYPSPTHIASGEVREVLATLGRTYYGANFDASRGTVRKHARRIKEHESVVSAADLQDPDIAFYMEHNRGYDRGDGLIALCPMDLGNLVHLVRRQLRKHLARPEPSPAVTAHRQPVPLGS